MMNSILICIFPFPLLGDVDGVRLKGEFERVAVITNKDVQLDSRKSTIKLRFTDKDVEFIYTDPSEAGIPYHGAKLKVSYSVKGKAKRFKVFHKESGHGDVMFYGIYRAKDDKILIKLFVAAAPGGGAANKEDLDLYFSNDPYPKDFSPPPFPSLQTLWVMSKKEFEKPRRKSQTIDK